VMRALEKDPAKRPSTAKELYQQISAVVRGESSTTGEHRLQRSSPGLRRPSDATMPSPVGQSSTQRLKRTDTMVYDTLTSLYNSVFMALRIDSEIQAAKSTADKFSLLLFGFDNFKSINQKYGFVAGDFVLKEFASWLGQTITEQATIGRNRGDEFLVIFPADGKQALEIAKGVLEKAKREFVIEIEAGQQLIPSVSCGVAQFPGDGETASELIEQAVASLKQAKVAGQHQAYWLKQVQSLTNIGPSYNFDIFVGRKLELEKLDREFEKVLMMQGRPVYITGDTGVGKKRLAEEFRRRLAGKDLLFLRGRFYESSQATPYKTIYDSLYIHLAPMLEDNPDQIRDIFGALSDKIMKDFQEGESFRFFNSVIQSGTEQEKYLVFDYLTKIFLSLARHQPLIYLLEDMQWADSLSLEFLSYLNNNATHSRLMSIGCAKIEGLVDKHPLRIWLRNISRSGCEILQLQPLAEPEVEQMIEEIFTRVVFPPGTVKTLYKETKGNPYFLVEIIRFLIEEGRIFFRDGVWKCEELENFLLPRSVIDVVEALLGRIENETADIFSKAAVFGDQFSFELLQRVTKLEEDALLDIIDEGLKNQIIKEKEGSDDEIYLFNHAIVQKVLYSRLNRRVRRSLHAQVGEAIEKVQKGSLSAVVGELAYHFHAAGDYQKSLKYSIQAGMRALKALSMGEAEKFFAWGEEAAEKLGLMPGSEEQSERPETEVLEQVANLTFNFAKLLISAGKLDRAIKLLDATMELASILNQEQLKAKTYTLFAEMSEASSDYQQTIDYCNYSLEIAEKEAGHPIVAINYSLIGTAHDRLGNYSQALDSFTKAIDFAKANQQHEQEAIAQRELAFTLIRHGRFRKALRCAEEAFKLSSKVGDKINQMISRSIIGQIFYHQGDYKRALENLEQALKSAGKLNRRRGQAIELYNIGEVYRAQGSFRYSIDHIQRSLEISREVGDRQYEALAKLSLGLIYKSSDSLEQAFDALNQALQQQRDVCNKSGEAEALIALAEIELERGNYREAEFLLHQAGDITDRIDNPILTWKHKYIEARLLLIKGNRNEAIASLRTSVGTIENLCDELSSDIDRNTFLHDKRDVYTLLTKLMESAN
ncbi:MAG: tetratricopeptide repeat protein, partial [Blastocatellia bacterium]|nr:tetratricopeptide repeat protein [Blastocatellia bacterium]